MIQIQRILCPVDFSPVSSAALHVFQPPLALVQTCRRQTEADALMG
jgi:hypothetical protein